MDWYNLSESEILKKFKVTKQAGLTNMAAIQKQKIYGKNKLQEKKPKSTFKKFISQFSDFMVIILLIAAAISFFVAIFEESSDYIDSVIILFIVVMNAIIGVIQENKAEKAIEGLKKLTSPKTKVIRSNKKINILTEDLVPGDIIVLELGDLVPADARLLEVYDLQTEESTLTGESLPVEKELSIINKKNVPIADQKNMVFASSIVTSGRGMAVVVETGMNTNVGKIANMIIEEESPKTPLQKKLEKTSKVLGIGITVICFIIFILGLLQKFEVIDIFMISISLAVAAIPEGLPAVVTIVLAMGIRRMAEKKAIIRKMPAVETLGSATVICSDKTGTLTQNKMTVKKIFSPEGQVSLSSEKGNKILSLCSLCNNSTLQGKTVVGEPTENALLSAFIDLNKSKSLLDKEYERVSEFPFSSKRKLMSTIHKLSDGKYRVIVKGAVDVLLNRAIKTESGIINQTIKNNIIKSNDLMAQEALRVIAVGYKDVDNIPNTMIESEKDLIFCGLVGMIDPPRKEAIFAVKECKAAGIKTVMITGDHIITAKAIASALGIYKKGDIAITGEDLDKIDDKTFQKDIFKYTVFARVSPEHKVKIVKAFQKKGAVVAMTGDGVNDAPALKVADIGCAMGKSGTDVAKSAADMILTDDNFSTIVEAIRQGRGIYQNIKKTVHFLISTNVGEIVTVLTAFLLRMPTPLLAVQLLWINLVTDSFPALALGVDPVDNDIMEKPPEKSEKGLFSKDRWVNIAVEGCFIGVISILAFTIGRVFFDITNNPIIGRTMAFSVLSFSQIIHVFNVRSNQSVFKTGIMNNMKMLYSFLFCAILQISVISVPMLSAFFRTANLNLIQWLIVIVLSLSPLLISEVEKRLIK